MSEQQNFRSAFNGFNREDVVRYLEYLNNKHASEISQLNSEIEYLRTQVGAVSAPEGNRDSVSEDQDPRIEELCANLEDKDDRLAQLAAEADALRAENEALKVEIDQKNGELETLRAEYEQVRLQKPVSMSRTEEELEVYRRAERVERRAKERAELVYHRVNGTLADATCKVEDAAALIGDMSEKVLAQISELQAAVSGSKQALADAADAMFALRPDPEDE